MGEEITPGMLDLVSTEVLIDTLMKRCNSALFIGSKPEQFAPYNYWYELKGDRVMCEGLHNELEAHLKRWRQMSVSASEDKESD